MITKMFLAVVVAAMSFSSLLAQPPHSPRRMMVDKEIMPQREALMKQLNLSESQEGQMQKLRIELMKKQTQLRAKIQTYRLDSKELFLADKVDRKVLENNVKGISDVQEQMKLNFIDHWFAVNQILTPDQQKLWKKHAMAMGDNMRAGMRDGMPERMRMRMRERFGDNVDD